MLFSRHDPRGLCAVNVGSDRQIWVWAAKLTKLIAVLSHWLVEFMRSFTSTTSINFTDQKVAGGVHVQSSSHREFRSNGCLGASVW